MRTAAMAIAWEMWARRRAGFLAIAGAGVALAGVLRYVGARLNPSEDARLAMAYMPMSVALAAMMALVNYAQEEGFPRRMFVRPVRTWELVTWPMAYGVIGVVGVYVLWAGVVARIGVSGLLAAVLAAGVASFQVVVWVLARHRLTRLAVLAGLGVELVTVGCMPHVYERSAGWGVERVVIASLVGQVVVVYLVALAYVGRERVGGGSWWAKTRPGKPAMAQIRAARWRPFGSPARALDWMEWRRGGLMLPAGVGIGAMAVLGMSWVAGHGKWSEEVTVTTLCWLGLMPVLMGGMVGVAFGRPDAWSMDGRVPGVVALRPVRCGEIVAAKMRVAAWGTVVAWVLLAGIAAAWVAWGAHARAVRDLWGLMGMIWGGARVAVVGGGVMCGMGVTWALMVSGMWPGLSRRSGPAAAWVGGGMVLLFMAILVAALWANDPHGAQRVILPALRWAPWVLPVLVGVKMVNMVRRVEAAREGDLVSARFVGACVEIWAAGVACVVGYAFVVSPALPWVRGLIVLGAVLVFPIGRLAGAAGALAGNRHRG